MIKSTSGFTIVELLIVIVVISILAAVTTVAYGGIQNRAIDNAVRSDILANIKKMNMYYTNYGEWPQTWPEMIQSGKAGKEFGLAGTKRAYYVNKPTATSNNGLLVCFYTPTTYGGWPGPTSATGEVLVAISASGNVFSATTESMAVQDITSNYNSNPSAGPCAAAGAYYNIKIGGAWYMTPYITYST